MKTALLFLLPLIAAAQFTTFPPGGSSSGNATTINGASVPASQPCLGSNAGSQLVPCSQTFPAFNALYLSDNGSGTTLSDRSGNGFNCTFGAGGLAPTWTGNGSLSFAGAQVVSCPAAAFNGAHTVLVWAKIYPSNFRGMFLNPNSTWILKSDANGQLRWSASSVTANTQNPQWTTNGVCSATPLDILRGNVSIGMADSALYFNGRPSIEGQYNSNPPGFCTMAPWSATTTVLLGAQSAAGAFGFIGEIYGVATSLSTMTTAQIAQADAAMRQLKAANGVAFTEQSFTQNPLIYIGDSITAGGGVNNNALRGYPWISYTQAGLPFDFYNNGYGGTTIAQGLSWYSQLVTPLLVPYTGAQQPTVMVEYGTNDSIAGTAAATIVTNLHSYCQNVHTSVVFAPQNALCVLASILPRGDSPGTDAIRTTVDTTMRSEWAAANSFYDGFTDLAMDPVMGYLPNTSNLTYYIADTIHPSQTGHARLAKIAAFSLQEAVQPKTPHWLDINIPVTVTAAGAQAGLTYTLPIFQLGKNQQLCGVGINVSQAFSGGAIAAATMSIGDSGGSATSYTSAVNIAATGNTQTWTPFGSTAGVVQANFTTVAANLSALTAGIVDVNLCVISQQ